MKTVICSHGFGVRADGRGLFTDVAASFPDYRFVTFDYNQIDEKGNMTVLPLQRQAKMLNDQIEKASGEIVLLCHSQGCIVAAMANLDKIKQLIFLAPPDNLDLPRFVGIFGNRKGAVFNPAGMSSIPRRDGTTTFIGKDYLKSIEECNVQELFKQVSDKHKLTIIEAADDEIVGKTNFPNIKAQIITLPGSHDFKDVGRQRLISQLRNLL